MSRGPVLIVLPYLAPDRVRALQALDAAEGIEVAVFGGRRHHATAGDGPIDPGFPLRHVRQRELFGLAASGRYRATIAASAGRLALPAAYLGARRTGIPFLYWTGIWHQVATPAHLAAAPVVRWIESQSDAVIAYGPHVADYARRHGARNVHVAPQPVDVGFWSLPGNRSRKRLELGEPAFLLVYAGRDAPGKGLEVALEAWRLSGVEGLFAIAGPSPRVEYEAANDVRWLGKMTPDRLRDLLAAADAVVVPSQRTRAFREPWALVTNEAMLQGAAVIATDAVGACAGGLVRNDETGLVVPAGNKMALARAIAALATDPERRHKLASRGRREALSYDPKAWSEAVSRALISVSSQTQPC